jgi:hypothetical protein
MTTSGSERFLDVIERLLVSLTQKRSELDGVPDFSEDYQLYRATLFSDGSVKFEKLEDFEPEHITEAFDTVSYYDHTVKSDHGYGLVMSFDSIEKIWRIIYRSDSIPHMFLVEHEDLAEALKTATRALVSVNEELDLQKEFMYFCEDQFPEVGGK